MPAVSRRIRGFQFRGASPTVYSPYAGQNVYVGGDFEMLASAEYMFPITADDMLRGVVFCDTGTVEPTISNWTDHYRVAPGFGLRICVPAMGPAPIALDFAFPVSWQPGDRPRCSASSWASTASVSPLARDAGEGPGVRAAGRLVLLNAAKNLPAIMQPDPSLRSG